MLFTAANLQNIFKLCKLSSCCYDDFFEIVCFCFCLLFAKDLNEFLSFLCLSCRSLVEYFIRVKWLSFVFSLVCTNTEGHDIG